MSIGNNVILVPNLRTNPCYTMTPKAERRLLDNGKERICWLE